ncbi:MAG: HAD family phosphatase [Saprospiraceae bacterium]|nr:HAD family phosphatase [Saprospiraceae bacterium]
MDKTIVFDLGGVLVDWNPRYLYRSVFNDDAKMNHFLSNICTGNWNELQDAGRSIQEATDVLVGHFPEYEIYIRMFYAEWQKMLNGPIDGTVDILKILKKQEYRILALTNWSAETFPIALGIFDFLHWFEDVLVSGKEKLIKPDPAIFNLLIKRYSLNPAQTIFIDDNIKNVATAKEVGLDAIHFTDPQILRMQLNERGIIL